MIRWLVCFGLVCSFILGIWKAGLSLDQRGYDRAVLEYMASSLVAASNAEKINQAKINEAINASKQRENNLQADAVNARRAANELRDQLAAVESGLSGSTRAAVDRFAATASIVFRECAAKYSDLAEEADELYSDRRTLIEAWPQ